MIIGLSCLPFKWHGLLCLAILPLSRVVCTILELVPCTSQLALRVQDVRLPNAGPFVPAFPACPTYLCVCNVRGFCPYERS